MVRKKENRFSSTDSAQSTCIPSTLLWCCWEMWYKFEFDRFPCSLDILDI